MDMIITFLFFAFGYFSGSILFAQVYGTLFNKDIIGQSKDGNPGTANAFMQGVCSAARLLLSAIF